VYHLCVWFRCIIYVCGLDVMVCQLDASFMCMVYVCYLCAWVWCNFTCDDLVNALMEMTVIGSSSKVDFVLWKWQWSCEVVTTILDYCFLLSWQQKRKHFLITPWTIIGNNVYHHHISTFSNNTFSGSAFLGDGGLFNYLLWGYIDSFLPSPMIFVE